MSCLPFAETEALWRKLFGGETPTHNRQFLERNNKKIALLIATGKLRKHDRDFHPTPGTLFTREYHGKVHQVIATADGQYEFEGRPYRSLSMIAREITSSRWSGPVFFGLKDYAAKSTAKKGGTK